MACVRPDGTLTENAKVVLRLLDLPLAPEEIAPRVNRPLFQVRSILRELQIQGLVLEADQGLFSISILGQAKLR
ncbi:MAG: hypothetical protein HY892_17785 [Deltaproteobacteria bacterium]|nr:hypothetical protein [Deltaproteobacteria bacterium]